MCLGGIIISQGYCFDHIVVEESEGEIIVYSLVSQNSGKCTDFLYQGKVDCAFYFYLWLRVTGEF